eukprot:TRINITY_DN4059_c0_g1_i1.p1 TRINITY_DN4059_c0_g1~~TRINITY_DN4059_c0_g1_i1.p1  ORF type:complete len:204 (+),score=19.24 TRINITY_DN4059_c0_g1_i1:238-849(+)
MRELLAWRHRDGCQVSFMAKNDSLRMHSKGDFHSEYSTYDGRLDLVFFNRQKNIATVVEVKMKESEDTVPRRNMIDYIQIRDKSYYDMLIPYLCSKIYGLGVVICSKKRMVVDHHQLELVDLVDIKPEDLQKLLRSRQSPELLGDDDETGIQTPVTPIKSKSNANTTTPRMQQTPSKADQKTLQEAHRLLNRNPIRRDSRTLR